MITYEAVRRATQLIGPTATRLPKSWLGTGMLASGVVLSRDRPHPQRSYDGMAMIEADESGRLPIHYAAMTDNVKEIEARLAEGDDINLGDKRGFTPLHMATQHDFRAGARFLLDRGADVDRPNASGNTPLFVAVFNSRGNGELIALLRERGADPHHANNTGQTPVGLARLIGNYDVAQYFSDLSS